MLKNIWSNSQTVILEKKVLATSYIDQCKIWSISTNALKRAQSHPEDKRNHVQISKKSLVEFVNYDKMHEVSRLYTLK